MSNQSAEPISGTTANGVPFLVTPPSDPASAPVVVAWHLLDPPRTETAMASALPLAGLDAWKVYFGLPLTGSRQPTGGMDEVMRLGMEDAAMNLFWPIHEQAVAEFPVAFADVRERFGIPENAARGLLGGSMGSSIAAAVLAGGESHAQAAVFVSPMLQLRPMVEELCRFFGIEYSWSDPSERADEKMDFVARAPELIATGAAILVVAGADDSASSTQPARDFAAAAAVDLRMLEGVEHALADEPGIAAAPQTVAAKQVDKLAAEWFSGNLSQR